MVSINPGTKSPVYHSDILNRATEGSEEDWRKIETEVVDTRDIQTSENSSLQSAPALPLNGIIKV